MRFSLKLCIIVILIILLPINVQAETSKYQAGKLVDEYILENEMSTPYGPYEYKGNEYFVVKLIPQNQVDLIKTQFVVDKTKGEIVLDQDVYYGVSKIDLYLNDIAANDYLTMYNDNTIAIREDISYWGDSQKFWSETADIATTTDEKNAAEEAASICGELVVKFEGELEVSQNLIDAINDILEDTPSDVEVDNYIDLKTQLNSDYKDSQKAVVEASDSFPPIYDKFTDSNYAYGLPKSDWESYKNTDLSELGNLDDNYKVLITSGQIDPWVQDNIDWSWESMNDRVASGSNILASLPGFGVSGSIVALLLLILLFKKK
jgi:hypothetical protein